MGRRLALCAVVGLVGCGGSSGPARHVELTATPARALIDVPVHIRVSGLRPDDHVRVSATTDDAAGGRWASAATFTANDRGVVDLARAPARDGTYAGVDGDGLLWSLRPAGGRRGLFFAPRIGESALRLSVSVAGHVAASTVVRRGTTSADVHEHQLTVRRDGMYGAWFSGRRSNRVPIVLIGGSEGGLTPLTDAALLAAHGHPALALAYFRAPGLPRELARIPLEYFERALAWVRTRTGARRVALLGASRGGEGVLVIASRFPRLVAGVVALVPGSQFGPSSNPALRDVPAWTIGGRPLPLYEPIPVERIRAPVLTASGGRDAVWPSAVFARQIQGRLARSRFAHPDFTYPRAGHGLSTLPYLPGLPQALSGGTPAADEAARVDLWPRVLRFLDALRG